MQTSAHISPALLCELALRDAIRHGRIPERTPRTQRVRRRSSHRSRGLFGQAVSGYDDRVIDVLEDGTNTLPPGDLPGQLLLDLGIITSTPDAV